MHVFKSLGFCLFALTLLTTLTTTSMAQTSDWSGSGEVGLVKASGNTDNENFNIGLGFTNQSGIWGQEIKLGLYQSSAENKSTADTVFADYGLKRDFSERRFLVGRIGYLDDAFDGFTAQTSASLGYGYRVILDEPNLWEVSIGLGYRDTKQSLRLADGSEIDGKDVSGPTLVLGSKYVRQITPNTQFIDTFKSDIGSDNTYVENDAALIVAMNEKFSLKAGVLIRHNTDPALGADNTDTVTTLNLVYNFAG
jgi:putative salt-induced outer membrane protein